MPSISSELFLVQLCQILIQKSEKFFRNSSHHFITQQVTPGDACAVCHQNVPGVVVRTGVIFLLLTSCYLGVHKCLKSL